MSDGLHQLDLFNGRDYRNAGAALALEAQEAVSPAWADRALQAIAEVASHSDTVHVDDILAVFDATPSHPNAWGAVWLRAIREGLIERTGQYRQTKDKRKHAHVYPVYRSRIFGNACEASQ